MLTTKLALKQTQSGRCHHVKTPSRKEVVVTVAYLDLNLSPLPTLPLFSTFHQSSCHSLQCCLLRTHIILSHNDIVCPQPLSHSPLTKGDYHKLQDTSLMVKFLDLLISIDKAKAMLSALQSSNMNGRLFLSILTSLSSDVPLEEQDRIINDSPWIIQNATLTIESRISSFCPYAKCLSHMPNLSSTIWNQLTLDMLLFLPIVF